MFPQLFSQMALFSVSPLVSFLIFQHLGFIFLSIYMFLHFNGTLKVEEIGDYSQFSIVTEQTGVGRGSEQYKRLPLFSLGVPPPY